MLFKDCSMLLKRLLVSACVLQGIMPVALSAPPTIRIINGTPDAVSFALVRAKRGTKFKELYVEVGSKEPKQSDRTAWADFQQEVKDALAALKDIISIKTLMPDPKGIVMNNFPQKLNLGTLSFEYDRALWIVPVADAAKLVAALANGKITNNSVIALEVGSATTAEITGKNGKFKLNMSGKLTEGAKALFNALIDGDEDVEPVIEVSLADASASKIKEVQREVEVQQQRLKAAQNKAAQKKIADKYPKK